MGIQVETSEAAIAHLVREFFGQKDIMLEREDTSPRFETGIS